MQAEEWVTLARSDEPIACHLTLDGDDEWEGASQCAGAATFRANTGKLPRNPEVARGQRDTTGVFASADEFLAHHRRQA
jgi:hypothetical protein